ncbi:hypothetical protein [Sneathiella sp.]|jgi:hypothetical protein|uniref:hypothetical protein n=1 Tax=Sneathiella sp. TaxID=1964365 RepID=UPI0039E4BF59
MVEQQIELKTSTKFDNLIDEGSEKQIWVAPKAPLSFRFVWDRMHFSAKLDLIENNHRIRILGELGPLPYTAEKPNFRERLLHLVAWETGDPHIKFVLEPKRHHIYLMIDHLLEEDLTGLALLNSVVTSMLQVRPYIELAKEVGWQHPSDTTPRDFNVAPNTGVSRAPAKEQAEDDGRDDAKISGTV